MGLGGKEGFWEKRDGGGGGGGGSQTLKRLPCVSTGDVPFMTMEIGAIVTATRLGQAQSSACMIASRQWWFAGVDIYTGIGNSINTLGLHVVRCV